MIEEEQGSKKQVSKSSDNYLSLVPQKSGSIWENVQILAVSRFVQSNNWRVNLFLPRKSDYGAYLQLWTVDQAIMTDQCRQLWRVSATQILQTLSSSSSTALKLFGWILFGANPQLAGVLIKELIWNSTASPKSGQSTLPDFPQICSDLPNGLARCIFCARGEDASNGGSEFCDDHDHGRHENFPSSRHGTVAATLLQC